jgi:hypothetical protein
MVHTGFQGFKEFNRLGNKKGETPAWRCTTGRIKWHARDLVKPRSKI